MSDGLPLPGAMKTEQEIRKRIRVHEAKAAFVERKLASPGLPQRTFIELQHSLWAYKGWADELYWVLGEKTDDDLASR